MQRDYNEMMAKGLNFLTHPEKWAWGIDAVFKDLYGNLINFIQPLNRPPAQKL